MAARQVDDQVESESPTPDEKREWAEMASIGLAHFTELSFLRFKLFLSLNSSTH